MLWLENKGFIKPRIEGYALIIRDFDDVVKLSSGEKHGGFISIISTKINGVR